MADVATAPKADQQVPLDTIPISPTEGSDSNEKSSSSDAAADGEIKTVFHDPENFNVKHPLMNTWSLWFTKPPSGKVCHAAHDTSDQANICRATTGQICSRRLFRSTRSRSSGASMYVPSAPHTTRY
jgi:hypothetical protein